MAAALLLLMCAGALCSAEAQDPYDQLADIEQKGVDLALERVASDPRVKHHYRFLQSVDKKEVQSGFGVKYLYHHFHLKATMCAKGTRETSAQGCAFRERTPLMDCAVCYKAVGEQIETSPEPYVDCIQKPRLTEEIKTNRLDQFRKMVYNTGGSSLLTSVHLIQQ